MISINSQIKALTRAGIYPALAIEIGKISSNYDDQESIPHLAWDINFMNKSSIMESSLKDWYSRTKGRFLYLLAAASSREGVDDSLKRFWYDIHSDMYFGPLNQMIKREELISFVDNDIDKTEELLINLAKEFYKDTISLPTFYISTAIILKDRHFQYASLSAGGTDSLNNRALNDVSRRIEDDLLRLEDFYYLVKEDKENKKNKKDDDILIITAAIIARLLLYPGNGRITYYDYWFGPKPYDGEVVIEKRNLGIAEHCQDCVYYSSLGWQMQGVLPSPGVSSQCISNCRCYLTRQLINSEDLNSWIGRI